MPVLKGRAWAPPKGQMIRERLDSVNSRISLSAAKRGLSREAVTLVSVTKGAGVSDMEELLGLGAGDIGENRVREALLKHRVIGDRARWHLIGHLQTNKVRDALRIFSLIHSVDSEHLLIEIDNEARKIAKVQEVLVEVNISGQEQKYGIPPEDAADFLRRVSPYRNVRVLGLMGVAPLVRGPEFARPYFRRLKEIFSEAAHLGLPANGEMRYLSMGMSQDFEVAIEEGANMVRVGSALFKE